MLERISISEPEFTELQQKLKQTDPEKPCVVPHAVPPPMPDARMVGCQKQIDRFYTAYENTGSRVMNLQS